MPRVIAGRVLIALGLAVATTGVATWGFLDRVIDPVGVNQRVIIRDGTRIWTGAGANALGMRWRFAQPLGDLQVAQVDVEADSDEWMWTGMAGWCELSTTARTGALAVGWPWPWINWRFAASEATEAFPPPPEIADEVAGVADAARRVLEGEGMLAWTPRIAIALFLTITMLTVAWWSVLMFAAKAKKVTKPGDSG